MVLACVLVVFPSLADARTDLYNPPPQSQIDSGITAEIDGRTMQFIRHKNYHPDKNADSYSSRIRLASDGPVTVKLKFHNGQSNLSFWTIGRYISHQQNGNEYTLRLPGPGHYYGYASGQTGRILIWIDDLDTLEVVSPSSSGVVNITSRGVSPNSSALQTSQIQSAINSAPANSTLYFPPGVYRSGTLSINRADLRIYLHRDALLKGSDNRDDYDGAFILMNGSRNVTLFGQGTIDANGMVTYGGSGNEVKIRNINMTNADGVTIKDLHFMNANSWSIHIYTSNNVNLYNVKIFGGKDGVDPDSSHNVTLDNMYIRSVDDAVAIKSRASGRTTNNIKILNSIIGSTRATAAKIGTENRANITNVLWENLDVIDSDRGLSIFVKEDGDTIENITYKRIKVWGVRTPFKNEPNSGGVNRIRNLVYEDIIMQMLNRGSVNVGYVGVLKGVTMKNWQVYAWFNDSEKDLFKADAGSDVVVDGMDVWQHGRYDDVFGGSGFISTTNVVEHGVPGPIPQFPPEVCVLSGVKLINGQELQDVEATETLVYLDGEPVDTSRGTRYQFEIEKGTHSISVSPPDGYLPHPQTCVESNCGEYSSNSQRLIDITCDQKKPVQVNWDLRGGIACERSTVTSRDITGRSSTRIVSRASGEIREVKYKFYNLNNSGNPYCIQGYPNSQGCPAGSGQLVLSGTLGVPAPFQADHREVIKDSNNQLVLEQNFWISNVRFRNIVPLSGSEPQWNESSWEGPKSRAELLLPDPERPVQAASTLLRDNKYVRTIWIRNNFYYNGYDYSNTQGVRWQTGTGWTPVAISLPGSGNIEASSLRNVPTGQVEQQIWQSGRRYKRILPINSQGLPDFSRTGGWSEVPASLGIAQGTIQGYAGTFIPGSDFIEAHWKNNQGYYRLLGINAGNPSYGNTAWSNPVQLETLLGKSVSYVTVTSSSLSAPDVANNQVPTQFLVKAEFTGKHNTTEASACNVQIVQNNNSGKLGDYNNNGVIDITDFSALVQRYGQTDCQYNINNDCKIDILDYTYLVTNYGT